MQLFSLCRGVETVIFDPSQFVVFGLAAVLLVAFGISILRSRIVWFVGGAAASYVVFVVLGVSLDVVPATSWLVERLGEVDLQELFRLLSE